MKKVLIFVILLLTVILASYGSFGFITKKIITSNIQKSTTSLPTPPATTISQGLFSSEAQVTFTIPVPEDNNTGVSAIPIILEQKIHHGPIILQKTQDGPSPWQPIKMYSEGIIKVGPFVSPEPPELQEIRELLTANLSVLLPISGPTVIKASGQPITKSNIYDHQTIVANWQGFSSETTISETPKSYTFKAEAPGLSITSGTSSLLKVDNLYLKGQFTEGPHEIALGTSEVGIDQLQITPPDEPQSLSANSLKMLIEISEGNNLLNLSQRIEVDQIIINAKVYGPGHIKLAISNLDAATIARLEQEIDSIQETTKDPTEMNQHLLQLLIEQSPALLKNSPSITISDLSLTSPKGQLTGEAKLAFNGEGDVLLNPIFIMSRTSLNVKIEADQLLITSIYKDFIKATLCEDNTDQICDQQAAKISNDKLKELIHKNTLVLENSKFGLTLSFKDGMFLLNGQPMQGSLF